MTTASSFLCGLNPEQRQAAENFHGPMMILAGAGTGKTRVMTTRIAHMVQRGVCPTRVVALTFTNKAAREMASRLAELLGGTSRVWVGTFHSFCLMVLRRQPRAFGLEPGFRLVGSGDQLQFVERALRDLGWEKMHHAAHCLSGISHAKNNLKRPGEPIGSGAAVGLGDAFDWDSLDVIYEWYQKQLALHRAIDFDDCIFRVVRSLADDPELRARLRQRYDYICVDEFQDTNLSQLELISDLATEHRNLCVVGDDDQSIYSWRGALVENLNLLEARFPETQWVKLEQNYRCAQGILNLSNAVIARNTQRRSKALWSKTESKSPVRLYEFYSPESEAQHVVKFVMGLAGRGVGFGDIAVLYRANNQASLIERALRQSRIPCQVIGGQSFFARAEIEDFLAYIRLWLHPGDPLSFWRVINQPPRGVGLVTQEKIAAAARERGCSLDRVCLDPELIVELGAGPCAGLSQFFQVFSVLPPDQVQSLEQLRQVLTGLLERSCLEAEVARCSKTSAARHAKQQNMRTVIEWFCDAAAEQLARSEPLDVPALVDRLTLGDAPPPGPQGAEARNTVHLMSVHASKGLEFYGVALVGLEDGTLPHRNAIDSETSGLNPNAIAEERRLFYVAMTRAKRELSLSYALDRPVAGRKCARQPSRFLSEFPPDSSDLQFVPAHEATETRSAPSESSKVAATLSRLRSLAHDLAPSG